MTGVLREGYPHFTIFQYKGRRHMVGNIICIVNRTQHELSYVKDGRQFTLEPGENWVNSDHVRFAKGQNPVLGSKDPQNLSFESLVGVKAAKGEKQRDDISLIDDETLGMLPKEVLNRSLLPSDRRNGTEVSAAFPRGRVGIEAPSSGLVDPGKFGGGVD